MRRSEKEASLVQVVVPRSGERQGHDGVIDEGGIYDGSTGSPLVCWYFLTGNNYTRTAPRPCYSWMGSCMGNLVAFLVAIPASEKGKKSILHPSDRLYPCLAVIIYLYVVQDL